MVNYDIYPDAALPCVARRLLRPAQRTVAAEAIEGDPAHSGTTDVAHLQENVTAAGLQLPDEDFSTLSGLRAK